MSFNRNHRDTLVPHEGLWDVFGSRFMPATTADNQARHRGRCQNLSRHLQESERDLRLPCVPRQAFTVIDVDYPTLRLQQAERA